MIGKRIEIKLDGAVVLSGTIYTVEHIEPIDSNISEIEVVCKDDDGHQFLEQFRLSNEALT
jgi:hypothetical protein